MKQNLRSLRISKLIQKIVTEYLIKNNTPELKAVNVTTVIITKDLQTATVFYRSLQSDIPLNKIEKKLNQVKGEIRSEIAHQLSTRKCPVVIFKYDDLIDYANRIEDLIKNNTN